MNPENNNESVGADSDMQKLEDQDNTYAYGSKPRTSDFKIGIIAILIGGALVFILIGIYVAWLPIFVGVALIFKFKTDNCFVAGLLFTVLCNTHHNHCLRIFYPVFCTGVL